MDVRFAPHNYSPALLLSHTPRPQRNSLPFIADTWASSSTMTQAFAKVTARQEKCNVVTRSIRRIHFMVRYSELVRLQLMVLYMMDIVQ
jgi:hypothetical protein